MVETRENKASSQDKRKTLIQILCVRPTAKFVETFASLLRTMNSTVYNVSLNSRLIRAYTIIIPFYNNIKDKISDHLWEEREYSTEFNRDAEPMELFPKIFSPANPDLEKKRTITTLASPDLADRFQEADVVRNLTFASCLSDVPEFLSYSNPRVNNI